MSEPSRIKLAIAHQAMTPGEIAAHALLLADLLDLQLVHLANQRTLLSTLAERLNTVQGALYRVVTSVKHIHERVNNGQAKTARQLLAELAALGLPPVSAQQIKFPEIPAYELPEYATAPIGTRK